MLTILLILVYEFTDGIPTLSELSKLALPPPPPPHPGHGATKEYANWRRGAHYQHIKSEANKLVEPRIDAILALPDWQEKQDAVDELFESVEFQLRESETILSGHPQFGAWVERAIESYLKGIKTGAEEDNAASTAEDSPSEEVGIEAGDAYPSTAEDDEALPVFMDCFSSDDAKDQMVPTILNPLKPHPHDGPGRMVEEWELAAHSASKRILLRQSTRKIAQAILESPSARVFVSGRRGVGKVRSQVDATCLRN